METIYVVEAFTLNLPTGPKRFEVGEHEVAKEEAEHWYAELHVQKKPKAKKAAGSSTESGEQTSETGEGDSKGKSKK